MVDSASGPLWVNALALSGSNIFAGTYGGGISISQDNGASWAAVDSGLTDSTGSNVLSLAVSGSNIFAAIGGNSLGTHGGDVFLSTNNGASWTPADSGLPDRTNGNNTIFSLAANGSNIFATTGEMSGFTVYRSTNNGANWTGIDSNMTNYSGVRSIAVSGSNVFAGTDIGDILFSTNEGASWAAIDSGLAGGVYAIQPLNSSNVFVGTASGGDGGRVYLLTNHGGFWDTVNTGLRTSYVLSLVVDSGYLYAATYGGEGAAGDTGAGVWRRPLVEMTTAVKVHQIEKPASFSLSQNYPNPFNPSTIIQFTVPYNGRAVLRVFNLLGQEVARLYDGIAATGEFHQATFDASHLASGVYFSRLEFDGKQTMKKMLLLK